MYNSQKEKRMELSNKTYKLSEQARSAITSCFLKALAQESDLQDLLSSLELLVLNEEGELGVMNPPTHINFGSEEELAEKLKDADV
jgi:hypothetical protein